MAPNGPSQEDDLEPWQLVQVLAYEAAKKVGLESLNAQDSLVQTKAIMDASGAAFFGPTLGLDI